MKVYKSGKRQGVFTNTDLAKNNNYSLVNPVAAKQADKILASPSKSETSAYAQTAPIDASNPNKANVIKD